MSYISARRSESSASRRSVDGDGDTTEDGGDDRDESKRRSRNLSEKKRRDQFNILITELSSMVSATPRKMDKSTVLKATISFLKAHNELSIQSKVQETQEDWKPSFLSNEEFTHLMLEALDGFVIVICGGGKVLYASESVTSLLGHLPSDFVNSTMYDFLPSEERSLLYNILSDPGGGGDEKRTNVSVILNVRQGRLELNEDEHHFQLVRFVGYHKRWISQKCGGGGGENSENQETLVHEVILDPSLNITKYVFVATGRLLDSDLVREMSVVVDSAHSEFSSRHSLEWKFLFLDHRAPPIIGYLPFEVLGTSGYDYYHVDDLEKVANCHESLMQKGEGTSCYYRFLTKGQQWIWLQTRYYITYHQWNSKPEFIACTHRVVSYSDVTKELRGDLNAEPSMESGHEPKQIKIESTWISSNSSDADYSKLKLLNGNSSFEFVNSSRKNSNSRKLSSSSSPSTLPPKIGTSFVSQINLPHVGSSGIVVMSNDYSTKIMAASSVHPSSSIPMISNSHSIHSKSNLTLNNKSGQSYISSSTFTPSEYNNNASINLSTISNFHLPMSLNSVFSESSSSLNSVPITPSSQVPSGHPAGIITSSQCSFQEQLMLKQAELQEELRKVSEQLLMTQCGLAQNETSIITDTHQQRHNQTPHMSIGHGFGPVSTPIHVHQDQRFGNIVQYQPGIGYSVPSGQDGDHSHVITN